MYVVFAAVFFLLIELRVRHWRDKSSGFKCDRGLWKGRLLKANHKKARECCFPVVFARSNSYLRATSSMPWVTPSHEATKYNFISRARHGFHNIDVIVRYHITSVTQVFSSEITFCAIHPLESRSIEAPAQLCWRKYSCRGGREARTVLVGERNWQDSSKLKQSFVHLFSWHPLCSQRGAAQ